MAKKETDRLKVHQSCNNDVLEPEIQLKMNRIDD